MISSGIGISAGLPRSHQVDAGNPQNRQSPATKLHFIRGKPGQVHGRPGQVFGKAGQVSSPEAEPTHCFRQHSENPILFRKSGGKDGALGLHGMLDSADCCSWWKSGASAPCKAKGRIYSALPKACAHPAKREERRNQNSEADGISTPAFAKDAKDGPPAH